MKTYLEQHVVEQFARYKSATLATFGEAGLQLSRVDYLSQYLRLYLLLPHGSDHLFNMEQQPEIILLSPSWRLNGRIAGVYRNPVAPPQHWHIVEVCPVQLHILSEKGYSSVETIDF